MKSKHLHCKACRVSKLYICIYITHILYFRLGFMARYKTGTNDEVQDTVGGHNTSALYELTIENSVEAIKLTKLEKKLEQGLKHKHTRC